MVWSEERVKVSSKMPGAPRSRYFDAMAEWAASPTPSLGPRRRLFDEVEIIDLTLEPDTPEIKDKRNKRKRYRPKRIEFIDLTGDE